MLSYRHAFHAGNHADVLKHAVEVLLLQHLNQKETPYWYVDTHAGAGLYALDEGYATQNAEYESGIARLWQRGDLPAPLAPYLDVISSFNPDGRLTRYPGSPLVAERVMAANAKLRLFELHPSDHRILQDNFAGRHRRCQIWQSDGFEGIKAILPPPPRRALILIDPPYEDKRDYQRVPTALSEGLKRFANGVYAVWYPLLQRAEMRALPEQLKKLPVKRWLDVTLSVCRPSADGFGMHGSGMFILNPPWTLAESLQTMLPWLTDTLAQGAGATHTLTYQAD
jgi:23S rRNA (adenine2030-N6)-methyltransferase